MSLVPRETLLVLDLDGQIAGVVNPATGELASFSSAEQLADWRIAMKAHTSAIAEATRIVDELLLARMDHDVSWTLNRPAGSIRAPSPTAGSEAAASWDGNQLWLVLTDLLKRGEISEQARAAAVESKVEYKPIAKGVKALMKRPELAPYIEACRLVVEPKKRSVSVK